MNRRSFLSATALFAWCGSLMPWRTRSPATSPTWHFSDEAVSWDLAWSGRIVRQPSLLAGQKEQCCGCGGSFSSPRPHDRCPHHLDGENTMGRTPIPGSPERAYLEYVAQHHPHPEYAHSEYHVLRRLKSGELSVDDVYIRLTSAEEIDAPGSAYAGSRGEAFAPYISVMA